MTSFISTIRSLPTRVWVTCKAHPRKSILLVVIVGIALVLMLTGSDTAEAPVEDARTPLVSVASVAAISQDTAPLLLLGEVRSVSQAELRAQKSGKVTQVYVRAGQYVPAGAVLAEIENAGERAAVLSAQGTVAAAQAQLDRVRAGDRGEDKASATAQAQSALVGLESAKNNARSTYSQAYTLAQDALYAQADDFFTNTYTVRPSFRVNSASYDERSILEKERVEIGYLLTQWKEAAQVTIPDSAIDTRLQTAERDLERIKNFMNTISSYVSEQELTDDFTSADKTAQEAKILGARASIDSARGAIQGARTGLAAALSAAQVTSLNESKSVTGARPEDIASAEAGVTQARGALLSAQALLENSLLRTPIAGTVSTLNVARGDFVSGQDTLAVVANPGAQEIEVFVSAVARERITVGQPVLVAGVHQGIVTSAAPGLDPITKKARVTAALTAKTSMVQGAFVELAFTGTSTAVTASSTDFRIPLSAIKVLPTGLAVFSVNEQGALVAHPIEEGTIVGDRMIVRDVAPDLLIVTDVRGLKEGEVVEIAR